MQRCNFIRGMNVSLQDMTHSQIALTNEIAVRLTDLYTAGVANGLTVFESSTVSRTLAVTPGAAYDSTGERIPVPILQDQVRYNGSLINAAAATYNINARHIEGNDGVTVVDSNGVCQFVHIYDTFLLAVLKSGTDVGLSTDIRLADVICTLAGSTLIFSTTSRQAMTRLV